VTVIRSFVTQLSPQEAERLRRWIGDDGVAAVWSVLEPALRAGPLIARARLRALLEERDGEHPAAAEAE
jgi:hypothetical protein